MLTVAVACAHGRRAAPDLEVFSPLHQTVAIEAPRAPVPTVGTQAEGVSVAHPDFENWPLEMWTDR